jgi:uncharacterized protein (TIGR00251 family)
MILPYHQHDQNGTKLYLKVTANASKNELCGVIEGANGQQFLKVKIAAVPDSGKANKALIKFLAKEWDVSLSDIEIISGKTTSIKKIMVKNLRFRP